MSYSQGVGQAAAAGAAAGTGQYAQEQASGFCSCAVLDRPFVKSIPGILKVVQMVLSLVGFICVTTGDKFTCPYRSAFGWYEFVAMGAFWSTFAVYLFLLLRCQERCCSCPWFNWPFIEFLYLIIVIVLWLIAAIVVSAQNCGYGSFQAGAAFGFFATAAYGANMYFVARAWWESRQQTQAASTTGPPAAGFDNPQGYDAEIGGNKY